MRRFKTNILVRDNRLEQMQSRGIIVYYEVLSNENYIKELKKKLVEESIEFLKSERKYELIEEAADVYEVLEHLSSALGLTLNFLHPEYFEKSSYKIVEYAQNLLKTDAKEDLENELEKFSLAFVGIINSAFLDTVKINNIKRKKQEKIGGFSKRIKTHYVEIDEGNQKELEYYILRPEKYPEIPTK